MQASDDDKASTILNGRVAATLGKINHLTYGILFLLLATIYFSTSVEGVNLFIFNVALVTSIGAIALNVLMGTAGQISIGNAAFLAIGGFSTIFFIRSDVPFPLDIAAGAIVAGVIGAVAALPAMRLRGLYLALSTLALHFIVIFAADKYQASSAGAVGFIDKPLFASKGIDSGQRFWAWLLFGLLSLVIIASSRLMRNRSGRAWRMIRDHEEAAPLLGIPVVRYKITVFVLSSMVIGAQGGLAFYFSGALTSETYTLLVAVQYLAMVLIGGMDSIVGAVLGASVIAVLPQVVPDLVSAVMSERFAQDHGSPAAQIIYGTLLVVFVVSSPDGLVGILRRWTAKLTRLLRPETDQRAPGEMEPAPESPQAASAERVPAKTGRLAGDVAPADVETSDLRALGEPGMAGERGRDG